MHFKLDTNTVLNRTAFLIENRKRNITFMRSVLDGTCTNPEYKNVNKNQVRISLEAEQGMLKDLIHNFLNDGLIKNEMKNTIEAYCGDACIKE